MNANQTRRHAPGATRTTEAQRHREKIRSLYLCVSVVCGAVVCGTWLSPLQGQQLLDRIVARVGGTAITQSDVDAALALGIVEPEPGQDRFASGARQLIDRQLLLAEVARFPPPEPSAAAIDAVMARMQSHAGAGFDAVMKRTGLDEQRVRQLARDTLRIQAYIEQRFGATAQTGTQEARDYYDSHRQEFTRNGVVAPFEEVEAAARQAASADRRRRTIAQWIADLRTRGDVVTPTR
jgi:hypothetical protein